MQEQREVFDASELPGLAALAQRVKRTGRALRIVQDSEELAVLQPPKKPRRRSPRGASTSADDPIWDIVGMGNSGGPGDVSIHKHKYLAEAYMPKRR